METVALNAETVVMKVPAIAEHLALLRTVVHYYAGRANLTLDQIDDLKMAVDEAAVQLLKQTTGSEIELELGRGEGGVVLCVSAQAAPASPLIDPSSFSWQILRALADELRVNAADGRASVVLVKHEAAVGGEARA